MTQPHLSEAKELFKRFLKPSPSVDLWKPVSGEAEATLLYLPPDSTAVETQHNPHATTPARPTSTSFCSAMLAKTRTAAWTRRGILLFYPLPLSSPNSSPT